MALLWSRKAGAPVLTASHIALTAEVTAEATATMQERDGDSNGNCNGDSEGNIDGNGDGKVAYLTLTLAAGETATEVREYLPF
jgi:hypothetical protein